MFIHLRRSTKIVILLLPYIVLSVCMLNACADTRHSLNGAGATYPAALYYRWFSQYKTATGRIITYQAVGSGVGAQLLKQAKVDFAVVDLPADTKGMPGLAYFPVVAETVGVIYNLPGVRMPIRLSGANLAAIYMGRISRWNDKRIRLENPGVKLPDLTVFPVHIGRRSAWTYLFAKFLSAESPRWNAEVGYDKTATWPQGAAGATEEFVYDMVKQTRGGIAYVSLNTRKLDKAISYCAIKNHAGQFVLPSQSNVSAALQGKLSQSIQDATVSLVDTPGKMSYPITSYSYLIISKQLAPGMVAEVAKLIRWISRYGQPAARKFGFVLPPKRLNQASERRLMQLQQ